MSTLESLKTNVRQLGSGGQFIKKSLIAVNGFILICSVILIIVGGVASAGQFNGLTSSTLANGIIAIGVLLFVISLLGCFGSLLENRMILIIFFALILFFAVVEIIIGIVAYFKRNELPDLASDAWTALYQSDTQAISDLENEFQCCGWYNESDRSVPPFGNEPTCSTYHPGYGSCNDGIFNSLYFVGRDPTSEPGRAVLREFETQYQCCGWLTQTDELFLPFYIQNYTTCIENLGNLPPCQPVLEAYWRHNTAIKNDQALITLEEEYRCCGWNITSDTPVPPYSNNTCINVKGFSTPCASAVDTSLIQSLTLVAGVSIAMAVLQLLSLILAFVMIYLTRTGKSGESSGKSRLQELMNDANKHKRFEDEEA